MVFLYTKDEYTKSKLELLGFELVKTNGGVYVFLQRQDLKFAKEELSDCDFVYSDELTF